MKNLKTSGTKALSRAELAKIKGGGDCNTIYAQCDALCGHFSTDYQTFESCVSASTTMCSPLAGWYIECPNG